MTHFNSKLSNSSLALPVVLALLFVLLSTGITNADDSSSNPSGNLVLTPTNIFEFIKTPPAIDTLVFRRTLFNRPRHFASQKEADKFIEDYKAGKKPNDVQLEELFALRYSSLTNFIFQQIDEPTNAWSKGTRLKTFVGCGDGLWWFLTPTGVISTDSTNGVYNVDGIENTVFKVNYGFATEILRAGMFDLEPDTIERDGRVISNSDELHFIGKSENGGIISGTAKSTAGLISEIRYSISGGDGPVQGRVIEIAHKQGVLHSIQVSNIYANQPDPKLYCNFEVLEVKYSSSPLVRPSSAVNQFLTTLDRNILVKKNGDMFSIEGNVQTSLIKHPNHGGNNENNHKKEIIIFLMIATLIVPLGLLFFKTTLTKKR